MQKWKCSVCGYETDANAPPENCPSCGSAWEEFYVKGNRPKDAYKTAFDIFMVP